MPTNFNIQFSKKQMIYPHRIVHCKKKDANNGTFWDDFAELFWNIITFLHFSTYEVDQYGLLNGLYYASLNYSGRLLSYFVQNCLVNRRLLSWRFTITKGYGYTKGRAIPRQGIGIASVAVATVRWLGDSPLTPMHDSYFNVCENYTNELKCTWHTSCTWPRCSSSFHSHATRTRYWKILFLYLNYV